MDEKMVSFICHEADMTRLERANKRLWIVVLVLIAVLLGTNGAWIYYESQFQVIEEKTEIEAEQETSDGGNNYVVGGDYGKTESKGN